MWKIIFMKKFIQSFLKNRYLIFTWTRYNIQASYLETKLGLVWLVLQPLMMTGIYSLVFSLVFNRGPRGGVPFINFFLSGMILWLSFNGTIMQSTGVIAQKVGLMGQTKFPPVVLIFVLFFEKLVDLIINFAILFVLNLLAGYYPNLAYVYLIPLLLIFFALELGGMFILSTIGLFVRDVPQVVSMLLRLLFYFSAIIFPADVLPEKAVDLLAFNPIFFLAENFRNVLFYAETPNLIHLMLWLSFSFTLLILGFKFFDSKSGVFADYN